MKPVHFTILIQGTPGKGMLAVVRDLVAQKETQVSSKTLADLMRLCNSKMAERIWHREGAKTAGKA